MFASRQCTSPLDVWSSFWIGVVATSLILVGCGRPAGNLDTRSLSEGSLQPSIAKGDDVDDADNARSAINPSGDAGVTGDERQPSLAELLLDPGDLEMARIKESEQPDATSDSPSEKNSAANDVGNATSSTESEVVEIPAELSGLRKLPPGRHITIVTDLPSSADVNSLPLLFDRAVEQWARYFRIPAERYRDFSMTGFIMQSKQRFASQGLLPSDLPPFLHGYQRGNQFWVMGDQPSGYYLRHLVLHEGTHGFMENVLGGTGAPWYREGIADFLATHLWDKNRLVLGYMPKDRDEVPYWGRIRILKEAFANGKALMIQEVMRLETREYLRVDAYAWSWAAAAFLDGHPIFQQRFRDLSKATKDNTIRFTRNFEQQVINELREMDEEWQLFVANIEYGYDFDRFTVVREPGRPIPGSGAIATIKADRGWQSTGYRVEAGQQYLISASGQCVVQSKPEVWPAEPSGITLRYHQGEPLGKLMGNVRLDQARPGLANLVRPLPIGLGRLVQPDGSGTLYLRINDSAAELADNKGDYTVRILPR